MAEPEVIDIPHVVWEGEFTLMGCRMRCYVLSDGQRILNAEDVHAWVRALNDGTIGDVDAAEVERFARWRIGVE